MAEQSPFDVHADDYDAWFDAHPNTFRSELLAIKRLLPPRGDWIEIGVGTGRFAAALGIPTGVEPSEAMAVRARKRGIHVLHGWAEDLPLPNQSVDSLFLITVLCFVEDLERTFIEAERVLRAGGHSLVAMIPRESPIGRIYADTGREDIFFRHATFRSVDDVVRAAGEAGLVIEETDQTLVGSPDEIDLHVQSPIAGHDLGSFVVLRARKA
jgi:SAM-dependent methyltransferase